MSTAVTDTGYGVTRRPLAVKLSQRAEGSKRVFVTGVWGAERVRELMKECGEVREVCAVTEAKRAGEEEEEGEKEEEEEGEREGVRGFFVEFSEAKAAEEA
eukprot:2671015-Rhodomonas_salina.1